MVNWEKREYDRELRELLEIRSELLNLNCGPQVQPVVAQLGFILGQVREGMPVDVGSFVSLVRTAEQTETESLEKKL